jgi:gamma-glutamyltranspeptidase/glutathione hydrolase
VALLAAPAAATGAHNPPVQPVTEPTAIGRGGATRRNTAATLAEAAFLASPPAQELTDTYGHVLAPTGEIGAATGIEFLRDGRVLAAAEPVRRGGGSAMIAPSRKHRD